jgi:hypothetical protein
MTNTTIIKLFQSPHDGAVPVEIKCFGLEDPTAPIWIANVTLSDKDKLPLRLPRFSLMAEIIIATTDRHILKGDLGNRQSEDAVGLVQLFDRMGNDIALWHIENPPNEEAIAQSRTIKITVPKNQLGNVLKGVSVREPQVRSERK